MTNFNYATVCFGRIVVCRFLQLEEIMDNVVASGIRYTLYRNGVCSYDGAAYAVPRIGESLSIDGNRVKITDVIWETGHACSSLGYREEDIAHVELYSIQDE
jgi:hypothetical protein